MSLKTVSKQPQINTVKTFLNALARSLWRRLNTRKTSQWCSFWRTSSATMWSNMPSICQMNSANVSWTTRSSKQLQKGTYKRLICTPSMSLLFYTNITRVSVQPVKCASSVSIIHPPRAAPLAVWPKSRLLSLTLAPSHNNKTAGARRRLKRLVAASKRVSGTLIVVYQTDPQHQLRQLRLNMFPRLISKIEIQSPQLLQRKKSTLVMMRELVRKMNWMLLRTVPWILRASARGGGVALEEARLRRQELMGLSTQTMSLINSLTKTVKNICSREISLK